jgi:hypothetical protein
MAQKFDLTELFQNAGHTGRISNILKKLCGIKGEACIDPSS